MRAFRGSSVGLALFVFYHAEVLVADTNDWLCSLDRRLRSDGLLHVHRKSAVEETTLGIDSLDRHRLLVEIGSEDAAGSAGDGSDRLSTSKRRKTKRASPPKIIRRKM